MKHTLTEKQAAALDMLRAHIKEKDTAPTFTEIMAALGLKSKNHVSSLLRALEERGYIRRIKGKNRAIALVPDNHNEVLKLREIRDAANTFVHLQGDFRRAFDEAQQSEETLDLSPKVATAFSALQKLVSGGGTT